MAFPPIRSYATRKTLGAHRTGLLNKARAHSAGIDREHRLNGGWSLDARAMERALNRQQARILLIDLHLRETAPKRRDRTQVHR